MERIVVGADGSPAGMAALRWAVEEARTRGCEVQAVLVFQYGPVGWALAAEGIPAPTIPYEEMQQEAERTLSRILGEIDSTGVEVTSVVRQGAVAQTLMELAKDASLLVVGTRGYGGFRGLLLGSTSHQCVSHSPCPVVVVPAPEDQDA